MLGIVVTLLCRSLRLRRSNHEVFDQYLHLNKRFILAFWHGGMMYPWYAHRGNRYLGLTSQSKDGDLLAKILRNWDYTVTRGSSSKGGKIALGIMTDFAKFEGSVLITPDGPRGPLEEFKPGAIIAAMRSQVPLFLLGVGYKNKKNLKSWDRFQIPKPFTRVNLVYSDPVFIPKDTGNEEVEKIIKRCSEELRKLNKIAEEFNT